MGVLGVKEGWFKLMRRKVEGGGGFLGMCFGRRGDSKRR